MQPYELLTALAESGNRDYANGAPVTSPAGALFKMQVMPATARNPGFGIRPAQSQTPDEYNRVGRDYLGAMQRRYGNDPAKMWAAYNAGPGRLDSAIQKYGPNWMQGLPAETRAYVSKNVGQLPKEQPQMANPIYSPPQPNLGDTPLTPQFDANAILANLPALKGKSNKGKVLGDILGVLGDSLMAYGGLQPAFGPSLRQQQADEQQQGFEREKFNAMLEEKRREALAPPQWLQDAQIFNQLPDPLKNTVLNYQDQMHPIFTATPQGTIRETRVPQSSSQTVNGVTYYNINGEWYDNPEGR